MITVALDYSGVYSFQYDPRARIDMLCDLFGVKDDSDLKKVAVREVENRFSKGIIGTNAYIKQMSIALGTQYSPSAHELEERWLSTTYPPSNAIKSLVADLRNHGVTCILLSDMCDFEVTAGFQLDRFSGFDMVYFSAVEQKVKGDGSLIKHMLTRVSSRTNRVIFFDDSPDIIDRARELGADAIHVDCSEIPTADELSSYIAKKISWHRKTSESAPI